MTSITTNNYDISKLGTTTFLLIDKTKLIPAPHYYKTLKGALNKARKIDNK